MEKVVWWASKLLIIIILVWRSSGRWRHTYICTRNLNVGRGAFGNIGNIGEWSSGACLVSGRNVSGCCGQGPEARWCTVIGSGFHEAFDTNQKGNFLNRWACMIPRVIFILYNHLTAYLTSTSMPYTVVVILRKGNQTDPCMYNIHFNEQIYTIFAVTWPLYETCACRYYFDGAIIINMEISKIFIGFEKYILRAHTRTHTHTHTHSIYIYIWQNPSSFCSYLAILMNYYIILHPLTNIVNFKIP